MKTSKKIATLVFVSFIVLGATTTAEATLVTGTLTSDGSDGATVVASPVASPTSGSYTIARQSVTLTAVNAEIRYTINNSEELTCTTGSVYSNSSEILFEALNEVQTIKAISCYSTGAYSSAVEFAYFITAPTGGVSSSGGTPTTPSTASYDFNNDGQIDVHDFNVLIVNWGTTGGATSATGDANGDGNVDILDFNLLMINWTN